jgi:hypothetical protein
MIQHGETECYRMSKVQRKCNVNATYHIQEHGLPRGPWLVQPPVSFYITELWHSSHLLALVVLLLLKKLASCFITNCGCSSGTQCPELGTITALTS